MDFDYEDATEDDIKPIRDVFGDQFDLVSKYVFDMVTSPKQHRRFLYIQGEKGQGKTHI
jgi:chromosomal replication initiation ATPase DnaA